MLKNFRSGIIAMSIFRKIVRPPRFYFCKVDIEKQKLKQNYKSQSQPQPQLQVVVQYSELLKIKSLLSGKDIDNQNNQNAEQKPFFNSQEQTLSFQLIKIDTLAQLYSLAESKTYGQTNDPNLLYLIFYRYLHLRTSQIQQLNKQKRQKITIITERIKPILYKLLVNISNMEQKLLESFLEQIIISKIYESLSFPSQIPKIKNCSHTSSTLLLNLLTLYPSYHEQIIKYYYISPQLIIHNGIEIIQTKFQVLVKIIKILPKQQSILKIIQEKIKNIQKQDQQLAENYEDLAKATLISLHCKQLHWFVHLCLKQLNIFKHISQKYAIQLLYNTLTTKFETNLAEMVSIVQQNLESIQQSQQSQQAIMEHLNAYHLLWNSIIIIYKQNSNICIKKIANYLLAESQVIPLQKLSVEENFQIFINFSTICFSKLVEFDKELLSRVTKRFLTYAAKEFQKDDLIIAVIVSLRLNELKFMLKHQNVLKSLETYNGKYSKITKDILLKYQQNL